MFPERSQDRSNNTPSTIYTINFKRISAVKFKVTHQTCNCPPDHVGWDGSVVLTAQNVPDEHLVAAFADPQVENLQTWE